mgnify:CR=1 FL=1
MNSERHILSILLENTSGALAHVAGLFAARGYNIESISAAPTENPTVTRITIGSRGDAPTVEQILILETVRTGAGGIARGERMIRL